VSILNVGSEFDVTEPDLKPFQSRGGKLILWQGWSDPSIPARATVDYYNSVIKKMGQSDSSNFIRLYMAPGMQHCGGGPGPNILGASPTRERDPQNNMFSALERWRETGVEPGEIVATKYKIDGNPASGIVRTRPLCPYPEVAKYKGAGSIDDAANFLCKAR
jgi:feruloyl esterase